MKKLFTLAAAVLASFSLMAADLSKGATYDLTTLSASDLTGTNDNYWKPDAAASPTYYGNGSSFKPTSASDFILNADNDKITKLDGLQLITGSSSGRARIYVNGNGLYFNSNAASLVMPGLKAGQEIVLTYKNVSSSEANFTLTNATGVQNTTAKTETLTVTANGDVTVTYQSNKFYLTRIEIAAACETADATFSAVSNALVITNEVTAPSTTLAFTKGDNTSDPIYTVTKGGESTTDASIAGTTFTATAAGTYVVTATQAGDGTYCEVIKQVTITVTASIPVTSCSIAGAKSGFIGKAETYTATAANATAYAWFVDGVEQSGKTDAEFVFTPTESKTYSIVGKARNDNNATDEWIASDPISLKVTSLFGEIIKAELTSGSAATVTGLVGGTADVSLSSSKKMDKGKYFGITLASGAFQEGDTVIITMTTAGSNYPCLFGDKAKTNELFLATEVSTDLEYKIVLPAAANGLQSLYLARDAGDEKYKWNPVLSSMSVVRPMPIKSTVEALDNVKVNGVAISAADLTNLKDDHYVNLDNQYAKAPVVTFTKKITTTYEDESSNISYKDIEVTAKDGDPNPTWEAEANIAEIKYKVIVQKAASHTVTYKFGEKVLGSETVGHSEHPAEYTLYQTQEGYNFGGWYREVELEEEVAYMDDENIDSDVTYYAKFTKTASITGSVYIDQAILNNGKGFDFGAALTAAGWTYENLNELDSLNDEKANRNEPFLGLKIKKAGAYLAGWIDGWTGVLVKFGNLPANIKVKLGAAEQEFTPAEIAEMGNILAIGQYDDAPAYVKISTTSDATVVIKQVTTWEDDVKEVTLPYGVVCAATENGTLAADKKSAIPGEKVTLTVTPDAGYKVADVQVNGKSLNAVEGVYSFLMPAENVTVTASFAEDTPSAIDNTEAAVKAVKMVENGMLIIKKDGKSYNVLGQTVR